MAANLKQPEDMPDLTELTKRGASAWSGVDAQELREWPRRVSFRAVLSEFLMLACCALFVAVCWFIAAVLFGG